MTALNSANRRPAFRRPPLRAAVERGVCLAIAILLLATWHVERFQVPSGSMAETLLGAHRCLACDDCGHEFRCGADEPVMPGKRAVCPNCGRVGQELASVDVIEGDRLLVHRQAFAFRSPRRWEMAAFRNPAAAGQIVVKRVAGLPRETVEIRHGDVYVNDAIQRKGLAELGGMAILVHDANSQPRHVPPRWQAEPAVTRWQSHDGRYWRPPAETNAAAARGGDEIDWLSYVHWRRRPGASYEIEEAPITDQCGYNQTRAVIEGYPVRDLLLSCRLRTSGRGRAAFFATDGQSQFLLQWEPAARRAELRQEGALVASAGDLSSPGADEIALELVLVDQQFVLALDGVVKLSHRYRPSAAPFHPTARPLAIGSQGLGLELRDIKVFRDVYYTPPRKNLPGAANLVGGGRQYQLGADEYFVLGDNSPLSSDSREHFDAPGIPRDLLLGKPFLVYFPSRSWGGAGGFQVPDPARIRYIH